MLLLLRTAWRITKPYTRKLLFVNGQKCILLFDGFFLFFSVSWFWFYFYFFGPLCGAGVCVKNTSNDMPVITHCWVAMCRCDENESIFAAFTIATLIIIVARYVQMPCRTCVCTLISDDMPTRQVWVHANQANDFIFHRNEENNKNNNNMKPARK